MTTEPPPKPTLDYAADTGRRIRFRRWIVRGILVLLIAGGAWLAVAIQREFQRVENEEAVAVWEGNARALEPDYTYFHEDPRHFHQRYRSLAWAADNLEAGLLDERREVRLATERYLIKLFELYPLEPGVERPEPPLFEPETREMLWRILIDEQIPEAGFPLVVDAKPIDMQRAIDVWPSLNPEIQNTVLLILLVCGPETPGAGDLILAAAGSPKIIFLPPTYDAVCWYWFDDDRYRERREALALDHWPERPDINALFDPAEAVRVIGHETDADGRPTTAAVSALARFGPMAPDEAAPLLPLLRDAAEETADEHPDYAAAAENAADRIEASMADAPQP
ncbi:MAG: hypothetical protein AAGI46_00975 [Planctomycetota bacterium]